MVSARTCSPTSPSAFCFASRGLRNSFNDDIGCGKLAGGTRKRPDLDELEDLFYLGAADMAEPGQEHQVCFDFGQGGIDQLAEPFSVAFLEVKQRYRVAGIGKHVGDTPAHAPGAGSKNTSVFYGFPCHLQIRSMRHSPAKKSALICVICG